MFNLKFNLKMAVNSLKRYDFIFSYEIKVITTGFVFDEALIIDDFVKPRVVARYLEFDFHTNLSKYAK